MKTASIHLTFAWILVTKHVHTQRADNHKDAAYLFRWEILVFQHPVNVVVIDGEQICRWFAKCHCFFARPRGFRFPETRCWFTIRIPRICLELIWRPGWINAESTTLARHWNNIGLLDDVLPPHLKAKQIFSLKKYHFAHKTCTNTVWF